MSVLCAVPREQESRPVTREDGTCSFDKKYLESPLCRVVTVEVQRKCGQEESTGGVARVAVSGFLVLELFSVAQCRRPLIIPGYWPHESEPSFSTGWPSPSIKPGGVKTAPSAELQ